jgi:hypothetical protein
MEMGDQVVAVYQKRVSRQKALVLWVVWRGDTIEQEERAEECGYEYKKQAAARRTAGNIEAERTARS